MADLHDLEKRVSNLFAGLGNSRDGSASEKGLRLRSRSRGRDNHRDSGGLLTLRSRSRDRRRRDGERGRERSRERRRRSKSGGKRDGHRDSHRESHRDSHRRRRSRSRDGDRGRNDQFSSSGAAKSDHGRQNSHSDNVRSIERHSHGVSTSRSDDQGISTRRDHQLSSGRSSDQLPHASRGHEQLPLTRRPSPLPPSPTRPPGEFEVSQLPKRTSTAPMVPKSSVPKSKSKGAAMAQSTTSVPKGKPSAGISSTMEGNIVSSAPALHRPKPSSAKPSSAPSLTSSVGVDSSAAGFSFPPSPPVANINVPQVPQTSSVQLSGDRNVRSPAVPANVSPLPYPLLPAVAKQKPVPGPTRPRMLPSARPTKALHEGVDGSKMKTDSLEAVADKADVAPWRVMRAKSKLSPTSGGVPSGGAPSGGAPSGGAPSGSAPSGGAPVKSDWLQRLKALRAKSAEVPIVSRPSPSVGGHTSTTEETISNNAKAGILSKRPVYKGPTSKATPPRPSRPTMLASNAQARQNQIAKAKSSLVKPTSKLKQEAKAKAVVSARTTRPSAFASGSAPVRYGDQEKQLREEQEKNGPEDMGHVDDGGSNEAQQPEEEEKSGLGDVWNLLL